MIKPKRILLNCCVLALLAIAVGAILISAANYLPINSTNQSASLKQLAGESYFPEVPSTAGGYGDFHSQNPTALELATDNLMVKMALYDGEDSGFIQAFRCYSTQYDDEYSRYWHGYVVILRFFLLFFDYYEIRIINGICQIMLFCAILHLLLKSKGLKHALALVTSYVLLMPAALAQCLQYSWIYYVAFGALLVYLKFRKYLEKDQRYIYFFLLLGAITTYLDLLTYPLLTWGLLIVWWLLLQNKQETTVGYVLKVIISAVSWVAGYAVMWGGKWAVGSLVLHENLFQKAFSEALLWTVNESEGGITWGDRLQALYLNWGTYSYKIYFVILIAWLLYAVVKGFFGYTKDSRMPALLLTGFSSLVWCITMAGHTTMHRIFTHRMFGVTIAAFLGIVLLCTDGKTVLLPIKKLLCHCLVIGVTGAVSFLLITQLRSDYRVNNYGPDFDKLTAEDMIYMNFTPSFSQITQMSFGLSVENGVAGEYRILLSDQGEVLYEERVSVSEWSDSNLQTLSVDWKLQKGKQYTLQIEPHGNDGDIFVWVTREGAEPLNELRGDFQIGANALRGQLLFGINYWCRPVGRYQCLFWIVTLACICFMVTASIFLHTGSKRFS